MVYEFSCCCNVNQVHDPVSMEFSFRDGKEGFVGLKAP